MYMSRILYKNIVLLYEYSKYNYMCMCTILYKNKNIVPLCEYV